MEFYKIPPLVAIQALNPNQLSIFTIGVTSEIVERMFTYLHVDMYTCRFSVPAYQAMTVEYLLGHNQFFGIGSETSFCKPQDLLLNNNRSCGYSVITDLHEVLIASQNKD